MTPEQALAKLEGRFKREKVAPEETAERIFDQDIVLPPIQNPRVKAEAESMLPKHILAKLEAKVAQEKQSRQEAPVPLSAPVPTPAVTMAAQPVIAQHEPAPAIIREIIKTEVVPVPVKSGITFAQVFGMILISGAVVVGALWRISVVSEESFAKGFKEGGASVSENVRMAQKENSDQLQYINQLKKDLKDSDDLVIKLQQDISKAKFNLETVSNQKVQSEKSLKDALETIPGKINSAVQPLEKKIEQMTQDYQKQVSDLTVQLGFAQNIIKDLEKELSDLQKIKAENELKAKIKEISEM